jgi:hypothetical protein
MFAVSGVITVVNSRSVSADEADWYRALVEAANAISETVNGQ